MESNESLLNAELQIDTTSHAYLAETAKWCNFLGILGFILSGIIGIVALFAGTFLGAMSSGFGSSSMISGGLVTVVYLILAAVYFFMSLFLYRFATKMKAALYSNDQDSLNNSFLNLKNLYKMMGIITIIYLSLVVLALIFGIGAAAFLR